MAETFSYLAGRASLYPKIIRRNQFSKAIIYCGDKTVKKERAKTGDSGIIICV